MVLENKSCMALIRIWMFPFFIILNHDTCITLDLLMQDESGGNAHDRGRDDWYFPHGRSPVTKKTRRSRGRSEVWKHFMKNTDETTMCSHCKTIFSSTTSTTNMRRHLVVKHQIKDIEWWMILKNDRLNESKSVAGNHWFRLSPSVALLRWQVWSSLGIRWTATATTRLDMYRVSHGLCVCL